MNSFCDILWVEDEHTVEEYFSDKQSFRVNRQKYMLKLLEDLESEENFSRYSCAILDINLNKGFGYYDTIDDEEERSESDELEAIENLLKRNQILIRPEHNLKQYDDQFKKNAGYYVYLYLVNRGMPSARICMLTANAGKNLNLTGAWEGNFIKAGLKPPEAFDRSLAKFGDVKEERLKFERWLAKTLTPAFRLRSCIIGMSFYAEKLLEDETLKVHVQNLYRIPLRLSEDEGTASPEFISALWQIVQPYDSKKSLSFGSLENAYQTTLTTTRNWFAHNCLKKSPPCLLTVAFLFGIGMRNLMKKRLSVSGVDVKDKEYRNEYRRWEDELIVLLKFLDGKVLPKIDKITSVLVMKSCKEFSDRIKNSRIPLTNDISKIIHEIGQKDRDLERRDTDLLRDFLHGFYPLKEGELFGNGIKFEFDKKTFNARKNKIEAQYLEAVKNTLALAVHRE